MEVSVAEEDAVVGGVGVEPAREVEGGFNEEEVAVGIPNAEREGGEMETDLEEEENGEPLIVEVVAEAEVAVEVEEVGGGGAGAGRVWGNGDREGERVVLPYVVLSEGR